MGTKKTKSIHSMWQIENMVKKQIQESLSGNFFQSIFDMRDSQLRHAQQIQQQMKDWQGYSFWDMPDQVDNGVGRNGSISTGPERHAGTQKFADEDEDEMSQMADRLQKQIHSFVNTVIKNSNAKK
jgi:hypothetical protein